MTWPHERYPEQMCIQLRKSTAQIRNDSEMRRRIKTLSFPIFFQKREPLLKKKAAISNRDIQLRKCAAHIRYGSEMRRHIKSLSFPMYIYVHIYSKCIYTYIYMYICKYVYLCISMCVCVYIQIDICGMCWWVCDMGWLRLVGSLKR